MSFHEPRGRDNAVTETPFGSLKVERLHSVRFATVRQAKDTVLGQLLWYEGCRTHSTLSYLSPVEFERSQPRSCRYRFH